MTCRDIGSSIYERERLYKHIIINNMYGEIKQNESFEKR